MNVNEVQEQAKYVAALGVSKVAIHFQARSAKKRAKKEFKAQQIIDGITLIRQDMSETPTALSTVKTEVATFVIEESTRKAAKKVTKKLEEMQEQFAAPTIPGGLVIVQQTTD